MQNINALQYISQYLEWLNSDRKGEDDLLVGWEGDREKRREWYKEKLSINAIDLLTEKDFSMMIKELWATAIWNNKEYKVRKLLEDNSFLEIKSQLKNLLYGSESLDKRWDSFRGSIKGLGPSSISEILAFSNPMQYGIVNLKPLSLLPVIGVITETELKEYGYNSINGTRYVNLLGVLTNVKDILRHNGFPEADFIDTDFFIAYLFYNVFNLYKERDKTSKIEGALGIKKEKEQTEEKKLKEGPQLTSIKIENHNEAEFILLKLGQLLGYDTYTPDINSTAYNKSLSEYTSLQQLPPFTHTDYYRTVKEIDVIWFEQEFPIMCFEVEHSTGVTSGLLRLFQIWRFNTKLFIVAPSEVNKKYEIEVSTKEPFRSQKDKYYFRSYEELSEFYLAVEKYYYSKKSFLATD